MSDKITVFFLGSTGYIGGAVLQLLLQDPRYDITALVRKKDKADVLSTRFGVRTIVGAMEDSALLAEEASKADVVLNIASFWEVPGIKAILDGAKARFEKTGKKPIFIHTSGAGLVAAEDVGGNASPGKVYIDTDVQTIASRAELDIASMGKVEPQDVPKLVHTILRRADEEGGYVRAYILYPPCVWGQQRGPLADAGITAVQPPGLKMLLTASIARGQGCVYNKGLNRWAIVEVHEYADLNKLVLGSAVANPNFPSGSQGHFFAAASDVQMLDAARAWTKALHAANKSHTDEPESLTSAELAPFDPSGLGMVVRLFGLEALCKSERGLELGWRPVLGTDKFLESMDEYVRAHLSEAETATKRV